VMAPGDGRDPVGWEDSFDVHHGLPTLAAILAP
jgi:hypothetical protein